MPKLTRAEKQALLARFMNLFSVPYETAYCYLMAEEWDYADAVQSYVVDHSVFIPAVRAN